MKNVRENEFQGSINFMKKIQLLKFNIKIITHVSFLTEMNDFFFDMLEAMKNLPSLPFFH